MEEKVVVNMEEVIMYIVEHSGLPVELVEEVLDLEEEWMFENGLAYYKEEIDSMLICEETILDTID